MELRGVLERHAAVRTLATDSVSPIRMRRILAEQIELATIGDTGSLESATAFIEQDVLFHQALIDAADHAMLARHYANLRVRQHRLGVTALFRSVDRQLTVCEEHERIVRPSAPGTRARPRRRPRPTSTAPCRSCSRPDRG